jgi:hypothetical protein
VIIGICSASRARAGTRIGDGLFHHNRHMLTFAGKTHQAIFVVGLGLSMAGAAAAWL